MDELYEEPDSGIEMYEVYDAELDEEVEIGVKYDATGSYFVDPETEEPIEISDNADMQEIYDGIKLIEQGYREGGEQGNRFIAMKEEEDDKYGNIISVKSYQDGEIKTLLEPLPSEGREHSLEKIRGGPYRRDIYILTEFGGKGLVHDDGVEMERIHEENGHYEEFEELDDGSIIGTVHDGKRYLVFETENDARVTRGSEL